MSEQTYKGNILVVDDQPVNLSLVEKVLSDLNVRIFKAISGAEALEIAEKNKIAVIILDVQMPEMDGFETAERLRKLENTKETPIIFVTAVGTEAEHIVQGYKSGAVDYMIKPVTPFVLKSKIKIFLEIDQKIAETNDKTTYLKQTNSKIKEELKRIKQEHGLIPICSWCRKIKCESGDWEKPEEYLERVASAEFTHCVCPSCSSKLSNKMKKH